MPYYKYVRGGYVDLLLLLIATVVGAVVAGGLGIKFAEQSLTNIPLKGFCCDTGSGNDCRPQPDKSIKFASPTSRNYPALINQQIKYDLLKSNATLYACTKHMKDSKQKAIYPDGSTHPIIMNTSDSLTNECAGSTGQDQLGDTAKRDPNGGDSHLPVNACVTIPDDELIYVCVKNCMMPYGSTPADNSCDNPSLDYYGTSHYPPQPGDTVFDIYYREQDSTLLANTPNFNQNGVPNVIANCYNVGNVTPTVLINSPWIEHKSLQLHTFDFNGGGGQVILPRPFCKPAVYLYPPKPENVHVSITTKGKIIYTNPLYPKDGWTVFANPNGNLLYNNMSYDYLFYEAQIPDSLIPKQDTGYSVKYSDLKNFFDTQLPKFGLNNKEKQQMTNYWLKALTKAPYYKISLIPQSVINNISDLNINPKPNSILRLDLSFEPMDNPISISPPILSNFNRSGFTVVEWGGFFKQDSKHPFTCLM